MPHGWTKVPTSPPREARDRIEKACREHGGKLVGNQTYYEGDVCYALIRFPEDRARARKLVSELGDGAEVVHTLVDDWEKEQGAPHPLDED
jgi:hypothetical protein